MKPKSNSALRVIVMISSSLLITVAIVSCSAGRKAHSSAASTTPTVTPAPPPPPPPAAAPAAVYINSEKEAAVTKTDVVVLQEKKADQTTEEEPFVVVEEMPMFPGGDKALLEYIVKNVTYPEAAAKNGISGRVIIRFCVSASGKVDRVSVLRGVSPELNAEATRVIYSLPEFSPGKQGGKPVPVWYMVPVEFSLAKDTAKDKPVNPVIK